jgi:glycosyltransferase involved in cell wall biosynthesis
MRIKVLHVLETLGSGGVEKRRMLLAKYLDPSRFEQKIVCTNTQGPLADAIREQGVAVIPIGIIYTPLQLHTYRNMLRVIREFKPDIIHGAVFEGVTLAAVCGFLGRVPTVIIEETSDPQNRRWKGNLLMKGFSRLADYAVGISPMVVGYLRRLGIAEKKIRLITNGVDIPQIAGLDDVHRVRKEMGIGSDDFVIGSVGRLGNFHKRFSDLILALNILRDRIPQAKLIIAGDGPDRAMLEKLVEKHNLAGRVIFTGYQFDLSPYYQCMDVFALASHMEGFGLVLAEAMFYKLPVVASRVGGMVDIVVEGETGFLVPRHSPESFAEKIEALYNDPARRRAMGLRGYERALKEYSPQAYVSKVLSLYEEAYAKKRR